MKREIKFRVFNTKLNKMMIGQDVQNFTLAQLNGIVGARIMQFTGLKDAKGKDVYEGDYLQDDDTDSVIHRIIWNNDDGRFDVEWWQGDDNWEIHDEAWQGIGDIIKNLEVIGNVWEHTNLLKNKEP